MGQNTNPTGGKPLFNIEGRPEEHEEVIKRQGQFARVLRAQTCPCMKHGQPLLDCNMCGAKGYIYSYQRCIEILDENSPHGDPCPNIVKPFWNPIKSVKHVSAINSFEADDFNAQGQLTVAEFDDTEICLDPNQVIPNPFQAIRVSYEYDHWDLIEETVKGTGKYVVEMPGTRFDDNIDNQFVSNFQNVYSDITKVEESDYDVKGFYKRYVTFDTNVAAPALGVDINIKYWVSKPHRVVVTNMTDHLLREQEAFSDMNPGDAMINSPGFLDVGEGDRITLLASLQRKTELKLKTDAARVELAEFDIEDVVGFIVDEDENKYVNNTDFVLDSYGFIEWLSGGSRPVTGKQYSISYNYFPTYIIYRELPTYIGHENKRWPRTFMAKKFTRLFLKQREDLVTAETVAPASGGSTNNNYSLRDIDL